jgi:RHH-type proline utilization regulon transcriptional repressor/proline dehydrogenase/delta 1-pyrroline-5-carboxylate dehydrogenase
VKERLRFVGASEVDGSDIADRPGRSRREGQPAARNWRRRPGAIVGIVDTAKDSRSRCGAWWPNARLCVNTTAAGGNASLMTLGL